MSYEKHESEILTHERALRDSKDHKRPLPTLKEIDAEVAKGKSVNTANWKHYRAAKAEHKRFTDLHKTLFAVNLEHKPKEQKRQVQRSRGDDLSV